MYMYQTIKRLSLVTLLLSVSAKNNAGLKSIIRDFSNSTSAVNTVAVNTVAQPNIGAKAAENSAKAVTKLLLSLPSCKGILWSNDLGSRTVKTTLPAIIVAGLGYCGYRGLNSLKSNAVTKSGTEIQKEHADINATFPQAKHANPDEVFPKVESLLKIRSDLQAELQKKEAELKASEASIQELQNKEAALKASEALIQDSENEISNIKKVLSLVEQELTQTKQQLEQKNNKQLAQQKTEQRDVLVSATPAQNNKCVQCKKCSNKKCSKKNGKKHRRRGSKKPCRSCKKTSRKGNLHGRRITLRKKK